MMLAWHSEAGQARPSETRSTRRLAVGCALLALLLAVAALAGHLFATPALHAVQSGLASMSPVTALALCLLALASLAGLRVRERAATILAGTSLGIAVMVLLSRVIFGNDYLNPALAPLWGVAPDTVGRTSAGTALSLGVLSLALLPRLRQRARLSDSLAAAGLLFSGVALAGYAFGAADLYTLPLFRTMALNTALAVFLLAGAAILGREEGGWAATIGAGGAPGSTTRRQLLFTLVPPATGWLLLQAADHDQLKYGAAMALLVVLTVAPLFWLILRDGKTLAELDNERRAKAAIEARHLSVLNAKLGAQALELGRLNAERLQRAEEATVRSEDRYRLLFDSIDAGFCVIEMKFDEEDFPVDYRFLEVNAAFATHTGLENARGRWMREMAPDHEQHWFNLYGDVARSGRPIRFENPAKALDDRWYDVHAFPIDTHEGRHVGILFNDVTQRRRTELQLQQVNATLEQRVEAAVTERELVQAALRQSQKMDAMGQLTGGVAHDFNNLLTPIIGTLDMLSRRGTGTERERRMIEGALQSAERAKVLVQRLLAFARRQPLKAEPVDVALVVRGMAGLVSSTSGPQIRLSVDVEKDLPPALADSHQLEMALLNLCVNARDAMPNGGTLSVMAGVVEVPGAFRGNAVKGLMPGNYIRLSVADSGTGMDAETARRAVEPFYSTKGIGKGTGLGLSMVHGLAAQLGGALEIDSKPGLGTRIDLFLPISLNKVTDVEVLGAVANDHRKRGRALVVDDEEFVRMATCNMLEELGYDTVEAGTGREAEMFLRTGEAIDIVVTDHLMPGMTGAELARTIRATWPRLPVLLVSGYADAEGIAADLPRLAKPFRQAELGQRLAEMARTDASAA